MPRSPKKRPPASPALPPTEEVRISEIICDETLQARAYVDPATVRTYKQAYASGAAFPPVRIALVDDVPMLVDGWHRLAALELLGRDTVDAIVTKETLAGAMGLASEANLKHGRSLRRSERRDSFRLYIKSGRNLEGNRPKSYRGMAADRGEALSTVHKWTKEMFPQLARRLGRPEVSGTGGLPDVPSPEEDRYAGVCHLLDQVLSLSRGVKDASMRGDLLRRFQGVLKKVEDEAPFITSESWF